MSGCTWFKVQSPTTGQQVDEQQLKQDQRKFDAETVAATDALKMELNQAQQQNATMKQQAQKDFDSATSQIKAQTQMLLDEASEKYAVSIEQANVNYDRIAKDIEHRVVSLTNSVARTNQDFTEAFKQLDEQRNLAQSILNTVDGVSSSFGPIGNLLGAGIGMAGVLFGLRGKRNEQQMRDAATRIVDAIDVAKSTDPQFAAKFKEHGKLISEWMGRDAIAFVNLAQNGTDNDERESVN